MDPPHVQASILTSGIAVTFGAFLNFSLDDLMLGVLYLLWPKCQVIESTSLRSIRANIFKSVETLRNFVDTMITNEMYSQ